LARTWITFKQEKKMAKAKIGSQGAAKNMLGRAGSGKKTSIGASNNSRPKSRSAKLSTKAYRGQGRV
jgi:hypothetical protein